MLVALLYLALVSSVRADDGDARLVSSLDELQAALSESVIHITLDAHLDVPATDSAQEAAFLVHGTEYIEGTCQQAPPSTFDVRWTPGQCVIRLNGASGFAALQDVQMLPEAPRTPVSFRSLHVQLADAQCDAEAFRLERGNFWLTGVKVEQTQTLSEARGCESGQGAALQAELAQLYAEEFMVFSFRSTPVQLVASTARLRSASFLNNVVSDGPASCIYVTGESYPDRTTALHLERTLFRGNSLVLPQTGVANLTERTIVIASAIVYSDEIRTVFNEAANDTTIATNPRQIPPGLFLTTRPSFEGIDGASGADDDNSSDDWDLAVVVGAAVGTLVLVIIIILLVCWCKSGPEPKVKSIPAPQIAHGERERAPSARHASRGREFRGSRHTRRLPSTVTSASSDVPSFYPLVPRIHPNPVATATNSSAIASVEIETASPRTPNDASTSINWVLADIPRSVFGKEGPRGMRGDNSSEASSQLPNPRATEGSVHVNQLPNPRAVEGSVQPAQQLPRVPSGEDMAGNVLLPASRLGSIVLPGALRAVETALESMHTSQALLVGQWRVLDASNRRRGRHGLVQFVKDKNERKEAAVKFYVAEPMFRREVALYGRDDVRHLMPAVKQLEQTQTLAPDGQYLPPFIVLERGLNITEWARERKPDSAMLLQTLMMVVDRVRQLHARHLVHRNLCPANIIWRRALNDWTLVDFGYTADISDSSEASLSALQLLPYSPPEVVAALRRGQTSMRVTPAVDIWTLGVVMYELCLKDSPLFPRGTSQRDMVDRLMGRQPLPWETADRQIASDRTRFLGDLQDPVLGCLNRSPEDRLSADQLLIELQRIPWSAEAAGEPAV